MIAYTMHDAPSDRDYESQGRQSEQEHWDEEAEAREQLELRRELEVCR